MKQLDELCELSRAALAAGEWAEVERTLTDRAHVSSSPEALELLAESVWWQRRPHDALTCWESASELYASSGLSPDAVRLAAWAAREHAALGSPAVASGWLSRAQTWVDDKALTDEAALGWMALARARDDEGAATVSLASGRSSADVDLIVLSLAAVGIRLIRAGDVGEGLRHFDEALATATTGRLARLRTLGEVCCDFVLATELTGDVERFAQWSDVVTSFVERHGFPEVMGFCSACCAEVEASKGEWDAVEQQLRAAIVGLPTDGQQARCLPPDAKLARLLVLQGRYEEAELLLADGAGDAVTLARAYLAKARGDHETARAASERVLRSLTKDPLQECEALAIQATSLAALGQHAEAGAGVQRLDTVTADAGPRPRALTALTRGQVALSVDDRDSARQSFEETIDLVAGVSGSIEGAEAHLQLARLSEDHPDFARAEARAALRTFEAVAATQRADEAASLLRLLGDRSRVGAKGHKTAAKLTSREQEVLQLVGAGLTNAEIADRLVISQKTAGNHVSSILTKLNVRSRTEAALYYLSDAGQA